MNLIKKISFLIVLTATFTACEKDEICIEEGTPKIIIRFYDAANRNTLKNVSNITIFIEGIEEEYIKIISPTDSIAIPVKVTEDITRLQFVVAGNTANNIPDNTDIVTLNYRREDEFIGRSCGFKTLFYEISSNVETDESNWIFSAETSEDPQNILNEKTAHVKIFH